jgi:hypothetical protein
MKRLFIVALALSSLAAASPPVQRGVRTVLGPKAFRDGDVIEITDVTATSSRLEPGDSVTVRGRARLTTRSSADLSLYLTQTESGGATESDATQTVKIERGLHKFKLKTVIKHRGMLHVTFYDPESGKPFGGVYFGTAEQMKKAAKWDVAYYLEDKPRK